MVQYFHHEVSLGYKETQDPSICMKFQPHEEDNTYYLAWTTTPWTIISNLALTINKNTCIKVLLIRTTLWQKRR